jgi:hypothetical protein
MRRERLILLAVLALLGGMAAIGACGTGAIGVDDCTKIEDALCEKAASIPCSEPNVLPHPANELSACTRFYSIACLHGLETTIAPTTPQVTACVAAINAIRTTELCSVIYNPETAPDAACAWLIPPEAGAEAGEAEAADGAADATTDALADAGNADAGDGTMDANALADAGGEGS